MGTDPALYVPFFVKPSFVLLVAVLITSILHVKIIWFGNFTKPFWKKTDYLWLTFALIGIFGLTLEARQLVASNQLDRAKASVTSWSGMLTRRIASLSQTPVVCKPSLASNQSATAERKQYDLACQWYTRTSNTFKIDTNRINKLPLFPVGIHIQEILQVHATTIDHLKEVNLAISHRDRVLSATKKSSLEWLLILLGPMLLGIAVAIRISKVTGELLIDAKLDQHASSKDVQELERSNQDQSK